MNTRRLILLAALAAPAFLSASDRKDSPTFGPKAGSRVTKTFETRTDMELDSFSLAVNGQDLGGMMGNIEVAIRSTLNVAVTDVYVAVADGRPTELRRNYDDLGSDVSLNMSADMAEGGGDQSFSSVSDLEGRTVVFRWNADNGDYDATFEEEGGDDTLLDGLREDMDLRVFLPTSEIAEGEQWSVDIKNLQSIIAPGGDLGMAPEGEDTDMEQFEDLFGPDFIATVSDLFDGTCVCTYKGTREVDGASLAEIDVEIKVTSNADLSEMITQFIEKMSESFGEAPEFSLDQADLDFEYEGSGVLLWNAAAARAQSFALQGDATVAVDVTISGDMEGEEGKAEFSVEMSGSMEQDVRVTE